jgi:hypothetical protein
VLATSCPVGSNPAASGGGGYAVAFSCN